MKEFYLRPFLNGVLWLGVIMSIVVLASQVDKAPFPLPENPLDGSQVFFDKGCINCHKVWEMGETFGPELTDIGRKWDFFGLAGALWSHSPKMIQVMREKDIPRPVLSAGEVEKLMAYLYYLGFFEDLGDYGQGEQVFDSKGCVRCHSLGVSPQKNRVSLDKYGRFASPVFMVTALWNHSSVVGEAMADVSFAPGEMSHLIAYIQGSALNREGEKIYMPPGNPKAGRDVFQAKSCHVCHGADPPDLPGRTLKTSLTEIVARMWSHSYEMWEAMRTRRIGVPHFGNQEMADLVSYLYFLGYFDQTASAREGEKVFIQKGCAVCHSREAVEDKKGVDLTVMADAGIFELISLMWNHLPEMEKMIEDYNLVWPKFEANEMNNLIRYIQSLK